MREVTEIALERHEEGMTIATFLQEIASSIFISVLIFSPLAFFDQAYPLGYRGTLVTLAFTLLWSWAISRMWRPGIVVASLIAGLLILIVAAAVTLLILDKLGAFAIGNVLASIIPIWFSVRIISDGWRLAHATKQECEVLATGRHGIAGIGRVLAAAFGIPAICRWLAGFWRRWTVRVLFLLLGLFRGLTIFLAILASALFMVGGWINWVFLIGVSVLLTSLMQHAARRFARVSAENLGKVDPRPPVLFLRSFRDDLVRLEWKRRGRFRNLLALTEPSPTLDHVLLDEATPLGPVVAIGVPGKEPPFGVARAYTSDDEWQAVIAQYAKSAKAIVVVIDDTVGVKWELTHIHDSGYLSKTLYLFRPSHTTLSANMLPVEIFRPDGSNDREIVHASRKCIGWYETTNGDIALLTTQQATKASYVCALRLFMREKFVPSG